MLHWLTENVSVFKIQHNAHREFHMSVEQHLAHRARIGDTPSFFEARDRDICVARDTLWELRVTLADGSVLDVAGPTLDKCVRAVRATVEGNELTLAA